MIVTFCGHKDTHLTRQEVYDFVMSVRGILDVSPDTRFLFCGENRFDEVCNHLVYRIQENYPLLKRTFVAPYTALGDEAFETSKAYDETILYYKWKDERTNIPANMKMMIDLANCVFVYIDHDQDDAYNTYRYAECKKKKIILIHSPQ